MALHVFRRFVKSFLKIYGIPLIFDQMQLTFYDRVFSSILVDLKRIKKQVQESQQQNEINFPQIYFAITFQSPQNKQISINLQPLFQVGRLNFRYLQIQWGFLFNEPQNQQYQSQLNLTQSKLFAPKIYKSLSKDQQTVKILQGQTQKIYEDTQKEAFFIIRDYRKMQNKCRLRIYNREWFRNKKQKEQGLKRKQIDDQLFKVINFQERQNTKINYSQHSDQGQSSNDNSCASGQNYVFKNEFTVFDWGRFPHFSRQTQK